jgi:AP-1 complex subunit mu
MYSQVNSSGNVVRSEILGAVKMKCYLSGMPELRLGLNDKVMFESTGRSQSFRFRFDSSSLYHLICSDSSASRGKAIEMEDVKFHQCVRLARFENDRTISFIPPDGEFELMSYRLSTPVKPLIWVEAAIESHKGRVEYMVKVKAQFKRRSSANNVEIYVPVPDDADSPKFRVCVSHGMRISVTDVFSVRPRLGPSYTLQTNQPLYGKLSSLGVPANFS